MAFLGVAGVVAGVVGTAGGITSLVSYPALLLVGIGPFAANVTNVVATITSGLSSSFASGPELRGHRDRLRALAPTAAVSGAGGALLLLVTPPGVFAWIVPVLVASAATLLLVAPRIGRWHRSRARSGDRMLARVAAIGVCAYGGYFGAGAGVLMLVVLLILLDEDLARANAVKNAVLAIAGLAPCVIYAVAGPVSWPAAVPLAIGAAIGGTLGPRLTRRVPHRLIRLVVALMGFGLAGWLVVEAVH